MKIADRDLLPPDATVILHVSKNRQVLKDGTCTGIDQDSFRCDSDGISVTWVEYFAGTPDEQFHQAAHALKGPLTFKKSGILARASVGEIVKVMGAAGRTVCVRRDEQDDNKAHCLIEGVNADEFGLLLAMTRAFPSTGFTRCTDVKNLV